MTIVMALAGLLLVAALVAVLSGRTVDLSRSVLLHVPVERAWKMVRDFGALHADYARGHSILRVEESSLIQGDGLAPRSVWRQRGTWDGQPYWAEIELVAADAPRALAVRLVRDSLGTHRALLRHRCELRLVPEGDADSKLSFRLTARLRGLALPLARRVAPERLRPRLLDLALRSFKQAAGEAAGAGEAPVTHAPGPAWAEMPPSDRSLGDRI